MASEKLFGDFLKELLYITNAKSKDISDCISYDASYISKWINNKSLPPKDDFPIIARKLSYFFSRKIFNLGAEKEIQKMIDKKILLDNEEPIRITIINIFYKCYYYELGYSQEEFKKDLIYVTDQDEIYVSIVDYLKKFLILNREPSIEFFVTTNLLELCSKSTVDIYHYYTANNACIKCHLMLKETDFRNWNKNIKPYISIFFSLFLFNIDIYLSDNFYLMDNIYIKDNTLISLKRDYQGSVFYMDIIHSDFIFKKVNETFKRQFNSQYLVFKSTNSKTLEYENAIISYMNKSPIYYFTAFFNWSFISREFFEKIADSKKINFKDKDAIYAMLDINEKILKSGQEINVIFDFESIFYFLKSYPTSIFRKEIKLSKANLLEYCQYISDLIRKYDNINLYSSTNFRALDGVKSHNVNMILSKSGLIVKKNMSILNELDNMYGYVTVPEITEKIFDYVDGKIKSTKISEKLDADSFLDYCKMYIYQ